MALSITFDKSDLLASTQLEPNWYRLKVMDIEARPGKKDPSTTTIAFKLQVSAGPKTAVPITMYLNSTSQKERFSQFAACFQRVEPGTPIDIESWKGREFEGFCKYDGTGDFKGNAVEDFRPVKG